MHRDQDVKSVLVWKLTKGAGLSKNFHMLEQEEEHPAIRGVHSSMMVVGVLGTVPWLLSMMGKIPGAASEYVRFTTWCHDQLREKRKVGLGAVICEIECTDDMQDYAKQVTSKDSVPRDIMSWLLKAADEGDPSAPPTDRAFDEEARLLIIAGR